MAQATGRTAPKAGGKTPSNQPGKTTAKMTAAQAKTDTVSAATTAAGSESAASATAGSETAPASRDGAARKGTNRVMQSLDTLVDPVARGTVVRGWMERTGVNRLLQPIGSVMNPAASKDQAGAGGATGSAKKPRSSSFKFLLGMMVFIFSAEFLVYLLSFVDNVVFHGALTHAVLGTVPLLGPVSVFFLLYILLTLGLWLALYRLNIIPRDPFGVKAQQAAARARSTRSGSTTATIGRNRAARQASGTTASAAKDSSSSRRVASGPNDAAYQRVKAAQRTRKRRSAKR